MIPIDMVMYSAAVAANAIAEATMTAWVILLLRAILVFIAVRVAAILVGAATSSGEVENFVIGFSIISFIADIVLIAVGLLAVRGLWGDALALSGIMGLVSDLVAVVIIIIRFSDWGFFS